MPPLMKGSATRTKGVWRKLWVACLGFSAAFFMTAEASARAASEVCFAVSIAREGGIARVAVDMSVRSRCV